jgi:glycosyltransferase involved in cell wall biosynthesis
MAAVTADPLVSVVIACYNGETYLAEALDSVLAQTHQPLEIVAVDDASTDATPDILARYEAKHPGRVVVSCQETNTGPCRARRVAFERARGEFVCWLDQDDLWEPTKVSEQLDIMSAHPEVGLVYTYFDAFDSATGESIPWQDAHHDIEGDILAPLFIRGCFIGSITTMVRRAAMEGRGLRIRDRDFSFGDDYYLWMALALDWRAARVPRVLAHYRRHARNESSRLEREHDVNLWRIALLREFLDEFPDARQRLGSASRVAFARHYQLAALNAVRSRRYRRGARLASRSLTSIAGR